MSVRLASHPLPRAWDGRAVAWDRWEREIPSFICPPPKPERCTCGSLASPYTARGLRDPDPEHVRRLKRLPRIGIRRPLVWPVYDLFATRCPDCGEVSVWDAEADQHWTLDESDYGPTGSWGWAGGLLDALLIDPKSQGSGS